LYDETAFSYYFRLIGYVEHLLGAKPIWDFELR